MTGMPPEIAATIAVLWGLAVSSPLWSVIVLAAYAIGRRQYSLTMLLTFLGVEAASIALAVVVYRNAIVARE